MCLNCGKPAFSRVKRRFIEKHFTHKKCQKFRCHSCHNIFFVDIGNPVGSFIPDGMI
ncbi:hypothetical protein GCM10007086_05740 [Photobacterium aphoticum]|nr:hypothetical protein GCM10007086_05740 [Photobacterium aphoticum]